ncbi:MAG: hypothetical protein IKO57_06825 [Treponema sp.]|nr:hypothetical protein [Treponema sp.]
MIKNLFIIVCAFMLAGCAPLINENFGESEHQTSNEQTSFSSIRLQIDSVEYTMRKEEDYFYVDVYISSSYREFYFFGYADDEYKTWSTYITVYGTGTYTLYEVSSNFGGFNLSSGSYRIRFYPSSLQMMVSWMGY